MNIKLKSLEIENLQLVETYGAMELLPKSKTLQTNGIHLTDVGGKEMAKAINNQMVLPEHNQAKVIKIQTEPVACKHEDMMITEAVEIPEDAVKHVIGKLGSRIKQIQLATSTNINVTKWEKANKQFQDGALISGKFCKVTKAKQDILSKIRELREKGVIATRRPRDNGDPTGASPVAKKMK